jgi:hypothetical protein
MIEQAPFYFGNAAADQVRDSGWFIGQFGFHRGNSRAKLARSAVIGARPTRCCIRRPIAVSKASLWLMELLLTTMAGNNGG